MNRVKRRIAAGQPYSWCLVDMLSVEVVEILGIAGLDCLMIDAEHGRIDESLILDVVRAAERYDMAPCIRLGEINPAQVGRLLDLGIQGIRRTRVRTADEVRELVDAAKYAPVGKRGFGRFARINGYGLAEEDEAVKAVNDALWLSISIETEEGCRNAAEICAVPGIDRVGIGNSDLAADLGVPGDYSNPRFQEVYQAARATISQSQYGWDDAGRATGSTNLLIAKCMRNAVANAQPR